MNAPLLRHLLASREAIKRSWVRSLHGEPGVSFLAPRVDGLLDEFYASITHSDAERVTQASVLDWDGRGPCPENALVRFLILGERAVLGEAAHATKLHAQSPAPDQGSELAEVYLVFHRIARRQIFGLCSRCVECRKTKSVPQEGAPASPLCSEEEIVSRIGKPK